MRLQTMIMDAAVDQRSDPRTARSAEFGRPAMVGVLGTTLVQILHGEIRNVCESGTQVRLDQPLPLSTLVRIEYDDNLLLGEVIACQPAETGWLVECRIEHGLFHLTLLSDVMAAQDS